MGFGITVLQIETILLFARFVSLKPVPFSLKVILSLSLTTDAASTNSSRVYTDIDNDFANETENQILKNRTVHL